MCQFNCLGEGWYVRISNGIGPFRNAAQAAGNMFFLGDHGVTMESRETKLISQRKFYHI